MPELINRHEALELLCHYCKYPCDKVLMCASWYAINSLDAVKLEYSDKSDVRRQLNERKLV